MRKLDTEGHQGDEWQVVKLIANKAAPGNPDADGSLFLEPKFRGARVKLRAVLYGAIFAPQIAGQIVTTSVQMGTNPHQTDRRVPFQKLGGGHDGIDHFRPYKLPPLAIEREVTRPLTGLCLP